MKEQIGPDLPSGRMSFARRWRPGAADTLRPTTYDVGQVVCRKPVPSTDGQETGR
jgi:hypothetical protein